MGAVLCALVCATGCGGIETHAPPSDATVDAAQDAGADAGQDAGRDTGRDAAPACVCDEPGPCCDGCWAIHVGEPCDDGLDCTTASSCTEEGACHGEPDACDYMLDEPQCQAVTCGEVSGCGAVQSIRQGLPCDDGDPRTYDDRCDAGACAGEPCECDAETVCCDGCLAIHEGAPCDDGDPETVGDACSGGECVGPCECEAGPCCDGCLFVDAGTVCEERVEYEQGCTDGLGRPYHRWYDATCSGVSADCDGELVRGDGAIGECGVGEVCDDGDCV